MEQMRRRLLASKILAAQRVMPGVVLTGARQTGKTTLVRTIEPKLAYFTLDDLGVLEQAAKAPEDLVSNRAMVLGEAQRLPAVLSAVKRAVGHKRKPGEFILTGSANLLLMGDAAKSLAGRAVYLELPPFCNFGKGWGARGS